MKRALIRVALAGAIAVALWLVLGITGAQTACAHDPRFACSPRSPERPIPITDPTKSWAFYGRLSPAAQDVYTMHLAEQTRVPIALLMETSDESNPARPSLQLVRGPQLVASIPFHTATPFYEPFSGTHYLTTSPRTLDLPSGDYVATISMSGGDAPQRYVMAIGSQERFSFGEIPYVLGSILRIRARGY